MPDVGFEDFVGFCRDYAFSSGDADFWRYAKESRGLSEDDVRALGLGFCPPCLSHPAMRDSGGRMIVPIRDAFGTLIAFAGRKLTRDPAQKPFWDTSFGFAKEKHLFGLFDAKKPIFNTGIAIVVEGYFDAMSFWRAGLTMTVATMGTAFSQEQMARLLFYTHRVVMCYDRDDTGPGAKGEDAAFDLCAKKFSWINMTRANLDPGCDPDDMVVKGRVAHLLKDILEKPLWTVDESVTTPQILLDRARRCWTDLAA